MFFFDRGEALGRWSGEARVQGLEIRADLGAFMTTIRFSGIL